MKVMSVIGSAEISDCGKYRWWLRRVLNDDNQRCVCFVMLNPSTADAEADDPTIRRCMGFARDWGYSILEVRNLFPYRATNKKELLKADNPCGDPRGLAELGNAHQAELMIAAWGTWVPFNRDWTMREVYSRGRPIYCLRKTGKGAPVHPLYQPADLTPQPFWNCPAPSAESGVTTNRG
jgi:hypothetical protein